MTRRAVEPSAKGSPVRLRLIEDPFERSWGISILMIRYDASDSDHFGTVPLTRQCVPLKFRLIQSCLSVG